MASVKNYLQKKEKREGKKTEDISKQIFAHRIKMLVWTVCIAAIFFLVVMAIYIQQKNLVFSGYMTVSSVKKEQYNGTSVLPYGNGFISYSKDGISYTDSKGNAMWNLTYEMQSPIVSIRDKWVAVGDYNGHMIYDISPDGAVKEIDTNLPIRKLTVAANGVVAVILEDSSVTWINVYNPSGEKAVGIKTTMAKSGYPMAVSLSDTGKLMQVTYLKAESGAMKSVVSFYNFDEVGQNYTDTMVSSYEYGNAVIPYCSFMDSTISFAVADNQLVIYEGTEIPKSIFNVFLNEQIQDVYYNSSYIVLVFTGTDGSGKYRADVYDKTGKKVLSKPFNMEYRDIIFAKDNMIIYNEAECIITGVNGKVRYEGELTEQTLLFRSLGSNRYLSVTQDSLDIIEMK